MKKQKSLYALLFIAISAILIAPLIGVRPLIVGAVLVAFSLLAKLPVGSFGMAIQVEIWTKDIVDSLFKNNEFAARAFSEDQYVIGGKIVHIPVAGAPSKSKKNLSDFPRTATKRTDDDILYGLDTYYREPKHIEKMEQYELSYDKRQSVVGEEQAQLIQDCMDGLLYRWALTGKNMDTPGNYILTSGGNTAEDVFAGATGERKTFTKAVFSTIKKKMDADNILRDGRIALLTANHHQQLIDSFSDAEKTNFYRNADMSKGVVGIYLDFTIYMRSSVQRWRKLNNVWAPVDELADDFVAGANDSEASLFYQEKAVSRAKGDVMIYDNQNRAEYYGDIISMNMRLGGRQRRAKGVYSVIGDIVTA